MAKNNSGAGAAQPKSGDNAVALCRKSGYMNTMNAMESKAKSQHPHTSKHYQWEGCGGSEQGGNIHGYAPE